MGEPVVFRSAAELASVPADAAAIKGDGVGDDDLEGLGRLTGLREVYLDGCQELGDRALGRIGELGSLRTLYVSGRHITDDGLESLAACPGLSEFGLDAPVTGEGFRPLAALPRLREIHLPVFPEGTLSGVRTLATLPALEKLCFYGVRGLDTEWLLALAHSKSLRELVLMGCPGATEEALQQLRAKMPELSIEVS